jgi:hypothetical protein
LVQLLALVALTHAPPLSRYRTRATPASFRRY